MQSVSFSKTAQTTLTFDTNPTYPFGDIDEINVATRRTAGNSSRRYYKGADASHIVMQWSQDNPLSKNDYDGGYDYATRSQTPSTQSLRNWFENVAVGPLNSFTYVSHNGASRTALFEINSMQLTEVVGLGYVGQIVLRIEWPDSGTAGASIGGLVTSDIIDLIRHCGAAADGTTNDTDAVLSAIASHVTTGKAIYMPPGSYLFDSDAIAWPNGNTATPNKGMAFFGAGAQNTFVKFTGTGKGFAIEGQVITGTAAISAGLLFAPSIRNMTIQGAAGQTAISLKRYMVADIDHVFFEAISGTTGFDTCISNTRNYYGSTPREDDYNTRLNIRGCLFRHFKDYGYDSCASDASPHEELIESCFFQGRSPSDYTSTAGIRSSAKNLMVMGTEVISCGDGIILDNATGTADVTPNTVKVDGCRIEGSRYSCMKIVRGWSIGLNATYLDCHNDEDATWNPYAINIPDDATGDIRGVNLTACSFMPHPTDTTWVGVHAGTNLATNGYITVQDPYINTLLSGQLRADGTRKGNILWRNAQRIKTLASTNVITDAIVDGESYPRISITPSGVYFGGGTVDVDAALIRLAANVIGSASGDSLGTTNSAWNSGHLILGAYHFWIDATGALRCKSGAPGSATDGAIVGGSNAILASLPSRPAAGSYQWAVLTDGSVYLQGPNSDTKLFTLSTPL